MPRRVLIFFALCFALTWSWWGLAFVLGATSAGALAGPVLLLGIFTPGMLALLLTRRAEGPPGMGALLERVFRWEVGFGWYLFAILYMPAVKLAVAGLHRALVGSWPHFGTTPVYLMLLALTVSTWAQAGEELGWRGYALPKLSARLGLGGASILLGLVWAAWHLPLFFRGGGDTVGQSFPAYLLQVTAISITMAWLYWRTGGSLLLVMLLHAAVNNLKDIVPSASPVPPGVFSLNASMVGWTTVALLWAGALVFLWQMRGVRDPTRSPAEVRSAAATLARPPQPQRTAATMQLPTHSAGCAGGPEAKPGADGC